MDHPFQIEDERPRTVGVPEVLEVTPDILQTPTNKTIELHNFQTEIANLALKEQRGIIKCATGGGKTLIFTAMLKAMNNKYPAMVLMRSKTLVEQTYEVFRQCGLEGIGRVNGDYFEPSHITVATFQSLHKISDLIPATKVLILDEVHEFTSKLSIETLKKFENTLFRWGFSATPFKSDDPTHNYKLKSWIGLQLCDITMEQLQESKVLCESEAHFWPVEEPKNIMEIEWPDAEEVGIVKNTSFHTQVAQLVQRIPSGRILILVKRLQHGDALHELLPGSYWVRGQDDAATREYVFSQLRQSDKPKVVAICSSIGFLGINVYCHHLINAAGGRSPNLIIQKIGRGLRKAQDKHKLEYHDFFFKNNVYLRKHSQIRMSTLRKEGHKVTSHF
jgi:superfamily II DNA or RNA helicase